jgi:hypothetical protein
LGTHRFDALLARDESVVDDYVYNRVEKKCIRLILDRVKSDHVEAAVEAAISRERSIQFRSQFGYLVNLIRVS